MLRQKKVEILQKRLDIVMSMLKDIQEELEDLAKEDVVEEVNKKPIVKIQDSDELMSEFPFK